MSALRWFALLVSFGTCFPAFAQDDWVGKRVVLKRPGIKIGYSDENGKQVFVAELTNLSYPVLKESQGFLRVQHRGEVGWFSKSDALLPEEAIPYFAERARSAKGNDSFPLAYLGWAHKEKQQYDLALAAYDAAIKREPRPDWYNNRGVIHLENKKYDQAIADFGEAIKLAPKFTMAYENRASTYALAGKMIPALDDWNTVLRMEPANAPALIRRAKIYLDQKDLPKAIADLTLILKDDPANVPVLIERAQIYIDQHKADAALADFTEALKHKKNDPDLLVSRSQLYTDKKEFAKAIADAEAALKVVPTFVDAVIARGWNRFLTGDYDAANVDFAKALEMDPKHALTYNCQAWLWATAPNDKYRDGKKALEFAKKAVELTSGKEPAFLDTQAAALAEIGDFDEAVRLQESVVKQLDAATDQAAESRGRLEAYRKKQAYRQVIAK